MHIAGFVSAPGRSVLVRALHACTLLIVLTFLARTSADADLWGHLAFGRDIVRAGAVHRADPYSFTSDQPWVNHEWLAEAAMWTAYAAGGAAGLVALKLLLVSMAGALLLVTWRDAGVPSRAADALLFAIALGAWPQLATMRPQVFSFALFAVLLFVLERVRTGRRGWAWWLPAVFAVWVNAHGGWLVGAGVLVVFASWDATRADVGVRSRLAFAAVCLSAALATLCNPYGPSMLAFLADTVRPSRGDIVEWRSVAELPSVALVLWLVPVTLAAVAAWRAGVGARKRSQASWTTALPIPWMLVVAALGIGSFRVARLVAFFALAVGFHLVPAGWRGDASAGLATMPRRPVKAGVLAGMSWVVLVVTAIGISGRAITMEGPWFPEPEAAVFVKGQGLRGRMLTWFDYGEYAIWHFSPAIRVSMDGRRETVYSDAVRAMNFAAYGGGAPGAAAVAALDPDYVWLPNTSPALATLGSEGWHAAFRGSRSTILSKSPIAPPVIAAAVTATRTFPGP